MPSAGRAPDAPVQQRLDALRRAHLPPERNHLDTHVTLFHQLPGLEEGAVEEAAAAARSCVAPAVELTGVRLLGRGVAVTPASPALAALRADLAGAWAPWRTPQDRAERDLHVTVLNKVAPQRARALHAELAASIAPERTRAVALALSRYDGGPWDLRAGSPSPGVSFWDSRSMDVVPGPPCSSVLVWRPGEFDDPRKAPAVLTSTCCLRSTTVGSRAAVYRAASDQGIVGVYDFLSDAVQHAGGGWAADGVLHRIDPFLPRADLLADEHLSGVFAHIQGRRTLPAVAAHRLLSLLPNPPFAAQPVLLG